MRRRDLIAALVWPVAAWSQKASKHIAYLALASMGHANST